MQPATTLGVLRRQGGRWTAVREPGRDPRVGVPYGHPEPAGFHRQDTEGVGPTGVPLGVGEEFGGQQLGSGREFGESVGGEDGTEGGTGDAGARGSCGSWRV